MRGLADINKPTVSTVEERNQRALWEAIDAILGSEALITSDCLDDQIARQKLIAVRNTQRPRWL